MGYVRQRRVPSDAAMRLLRWRLKQERGPARLRRRDLEEMREKAERALWRNAATLGVAEEFPDGDEKR